MVHHDDLKWANIKQKQQVKCGTMLNLIIVQYSTVPTRKKN
jgi:hypothetical protein